MPSIINPPKESTGADYILSPPIIGCIFDMPSLFGDNSVSSLSEALELNSDKIDQKLTNSRPTFVNLLTTSQDELNTTTYITNHDNLISNIILEPNSSTRLPDESS